MTQHTDDAIDLPDPPLQTTAAEGPLKEAEVIAHRLHGGKVRGKLQALSVSRQLLSLQQESNTEPLTLTFTDLRHLVFTRKLPLATAAEQVSPSLSVEQDTQTFRVVFVDGKILSGNTRGHFVDRGGLHVFQVINPSAMARIFIPSQNIKEYHIGPLLGEALVQDRPQLEKDVDQALALQQELREKKIGEYLLDNRALNPEQLKQVLDKQASNPGVVHGPYSTLVGQLLLDYGWVSQEQLDQALEEQQKDRHKKLGEILVEKGAIDTKHLYAVLSRVLGIPFVELDNFQIEDSALACIPNDIAHKYHIIPLCLYHDRLVVAVTDPSSTEAIDMAQFISGRSLELAIASEQDIEKAIGSHYPDADLEEDMLAAEETQISTVVEEHKELKRDEIEQLGSHKPIVRLVNRILLDAIRRRASDIHLRPMEEEVDLLFRIDGTLISIRHFNKALLLPIVSRIKIIGNMDIAEHRVPQDGRARITDGKALVDLRISVMPTVNGESVVIRLLNTESGLKKISQLGFNERDSALFTDLLHKSYGMILVTGPTGSGKSTTLYAALQEVIEQNVNIITVEDPVEYHIDGIEQIQVNVAQGYTFARALRNILRHDPDVIMIGEIRDQETGQIAIESALTGHLVLSTLHTNDSAGAVTRLLEMGIPSFLLKAALLGVLAQRLVRRNCSHCLQEESPDPAVRALLGVSEDEVFYKGAGCEHCNHTGYSGRLAVYELLKLTTTLRALIDEGASAEALHEVAVNEGMTPLTQNALAQARQRSTSLMEVYRVRLE